MLLGFKRTSPEPRQDHRQEPLWETRRIASCALGKLNANLTCTPDLSMARKAPVEARALNVPVADQVEVRMIGG